MKARRGKDQLLDFVDIALVLAIGSMASTLIAGKSAKESVQVAANHITYSVDHWSKYNANWNEWRSRT